MQEIVSSLKNNKLSPKLAYKNCTALRHNKLETRAQIQATFIAEFLLTNIQ